MAKAKKEKRPHQYPRKAVHGYCVRVTCDVHVEATGPSKARDNAVALVREAVEATGNAIGFQDAEVRWRVGD